MKFLTYILVTTLLGSTVLAEVWNKEDDPKLQEYKYTGDASKVSAPVGYAYDPTCNCIVKNASPARLDDKTNPGDSKSTAPSAADPTEKTK